MNRILIVEDEVPIAQLIEMSLARAGYQCEAVNDGCAAADKIELVKCFIINTTWNCHGGK